MDEWKLLYQRLRALGRHLFVLGLVLLLVIVAGLATPVIVIMYAVQQSQPWWMTTGATVFTLAGVAAVLHAIPPILGPGGVKGIVEAHGKIIMALLNAAPTAASRPRDNEPRGEFDPTRVELANRQAG